MSTRELIRLYPAAADAIVVAAGGAAGAAVAVIGAGLLIWYCVRRKRKPEQRLQPVGAMTSRLVRSVATGY